jgi:hypothetical protein
LAHERQEKNRNNNTEGLDALHQVERGRGNQTSLADDDLGTRCQSTQASAIQSKPNQGAVQKSFASGLSRAVKPPSNSSTNKKEKQNKTKKKKILFSRC